MPDIVAEVPTPAVRENYLIGAHVQGGDDVLVRASHLEHLDFESDFGAASCGLLHNNVVVSVVSEEIHSHADAFLKVLDPLHLRNEVDLYRNYF